MIDKRFKYFHSFPKNYHIGIWTSKEFSLPLWCWADDNYYCWMHEGIKYNTYKEISQLNDT